MSDPVLQWNDLFTAEQVQKFLSDWYKPQLLDPAVFQPSSAEWDVSYANSSYAGAFAPMNPNTVSTSTSITIQPYFGFPSAALLDDPEPAPTPVTPIPAPVIIPIDVAPRRMRLV
jgi:hypothetical protein